MSKNAFLGEAVMPSGAARHATWPEPISEQSTRKGGGVGPFVRARAAPTNRRSGIALVLTAALSPAAVTNPSDNMTSKSPSVAKNSLVWRHMHGATLPALFGVNEVETRQLAGTKPAGCRGSIVHCNTV